MTDISTFNNTDYNWEDEPTKEESFTARHVALAVIPHITGVLSLLGSTFIVVDVVRLKFKSVYHRLLFGLAISDIIASVGLSLSTWPIPEESTYAWGAIGNIQSCEFQGFLIQIGLATTLYNAFLSIYYVLLVRFNWRAESRQMKTFEEVAHSLAVLLGLGTAVASLVLNLYNDANLFCWIAPHPLDCENSITAEDGVGTCVRGDNAWVYRMSFYFSWLWASAIVVTLSMGILCHAVYQQSKKMDRYRQEGESTNSWRRMRSVTVQSSLYILAFVVTALPVSVARIMQAKYNCTSTFFPLSLTTVTFFPLQGFWNALIYIRPRYLRYKEKRQKMLASSTYTSATERSSMSSPFLSFLFSKRGRPNGEAAMGSSTDSSATRAPFDDSRVAHSTIS